MGRHQQRHLSERRSAGLSLVELLVATLVTLIGLLVITQVFAVYEGWKRTTTGVAQTQEAGLLGAFAIEQDLRNAGFGMIDLGCVKIAAYNANATPSNFVELSGSAVTIAIDTPVKWTDRVSVLYSSSPFANVKSALQQPMASVADSLYVDNGWGFGTRDMVLISQGTSCSVVQASGEPVEKQIANVTSSGSAWKLPHDTGDFPWNPPEGKDIFPPGGYGEGARVLNLGQLVDHSFYVEDGTLRLAERRSDDGSVVVYDLVPGVVGLRARCLPDPCSDQTTAVRFGLIVKSGNREREAVVQQEVSPREPVDVAGSIEFWPGDSDPMPISVEERHYRYRVFNTVVPLKNKIWNK